MTEIKKDMTFAEALEVSGRKGAEIMAKYGLHCIGCHIAASETVEEGCAAHSLSEKETNKMIEEINATLKKS